MKRLSGGGRGGARDNAGQPAVYRPKNEARMYLPNENADQVLRRARDRTGRSMSDIVEHLLRKHGARLDTVTTFTGRTRSVVQKRVLLTSEAAGILDALIVRSGEGLNDVIDYLVTVHAPSLMRFGVTSTEQSAARRTA